MAIYGTLGSVSHGTLREEDLIPEFVDLLDDLKEKMAMEKLEGDAHLERVKEVARLDEVISRIEGEMYDEDGELNEEYFESEGASYDLNETLVDELQNFAPPFCYFGTTEGDGADFGFWWSSEAFEEGVKEGIVVEVDDIDGWEEQPVVQHEDVEYVAQVSDHGNVELYAVVKDGDKVKLEHILGVV